MIDTNTYTHTHTHTHTRAGATYESTVGKEAAIVGFTTIAVGSTARDLVNALNHFNDSVCRNLQ